MTSHDSRFTHPLTLTSDPISLTLATRNRKTNRAHPHDANATHDTGTQIDDDPSKISLRSALCKSSTELQLEDRIVAWQKHKQANQEHPLDLIPHTPSTFQKAASNPETFSRVAESPAPQLSFYLRRASSCTSVIVTPHHHHRPIPTNDDHLPLTTANLLAATGRASNLHDRRRRSSTQVVWRCLRTGSLHTLRFLGRAIAAPVAIPANAIMRKRRVRAPACLEGRARRTEEEGQRQEQEQRPYLLMGGQGWELDSAWSPFESGCGE